MEYGARIKTTGEIAFIEKDAENSYNQRGFKIAKRVLDIVGASAALLLLSPLLLLTAILIRCESRGSVLFAQTRVGKYGRRFRLWKFRSMCVNANDLKSSLREQADLSDGVRFKMKNDPRVTRVGKFIRKFSIDELPQLFNVLAGEMSLVGPRPALPEEVSEYTSWQRLRLRAKPGITCIWQVSGRSEIPFLEQVQMDIDYYKDASIRLDLLLLLKTIPAVITAKGAH